MKALNLVSLAVLLLLTACVNEHAITSSLAGFSGPPQEQLPQAAPDEKQAAEEVVVPRQQTHRQHGSVSAKAAPKRVDINKIDDDRSYDPHANDRPHYCAEYYSGGCYGSAYYGAGYYGRYRSPRYDW